MRKSTILSAIFLLCVHAASAEESGRTYVGVEPARPRMVPYNRAADAVVDDSRTSRYVAPALQWQQRGDTLVASFAKPVAWVNRQVLVRVGGAECAYEVEVNGETAGYAPCGVGAAEYNVTSLTKDDMNELRVVLRRDVPADRLCAATTTKGVRDVEVVCQPTIRVRDIFSRTQLNDSGDGVTEVGVAVKCNALNDKACRLHYVLRANDTLVVAEGYRDMQLDMRREDTVRFACVVPKALLWSAASPKMLRLDIENRIDNRPSEYVSREMGFREAHLREGVLYVNGEPVTMHLVEASELKSLDDVAQRGGNGVVLTSDHEAEALLRECDRRGLYAVVCVPIDVSGQGDNIRRGGNPTNDRSWREAFIERNERSYHSVKYHPSVVGYMIARGRTSGICIYDTFLRLKQLVLDMPVFYPGAGSEWCSDKVSIK